MIEREREEFARRHPRSRELHERAAGSLLAGVPMSWMTIWAGGQPIYLDHAEGARLLAAEEDADYEDTGGVGGTLAGNALSLAAARACLGEVLTAEAFERMSALRERFVAGVEAALERHSVPWSVVSLGARAEYRFAAVPPRTGAESAAAADRDVQEYLHLYLLNRGC